ncbi:MAG TPA: SMC-Scp complex subunit ScpB [Actinomycetota bacterium]|nr:SMC-Scp complex subunit ScpB [Actinomycetota bacterium]
MGDGDEEHGRASEVRRAVEAILFLADEPVPSSVLAQAVEVGRRDVEAVLRDLAGELEGRGSGITLKEVAGGWRMLTHPEASPYVQQFILSSRHARLTKASLEALAIVAYKQPVTRYQVSGIRGVDSDGVLRALAERGLVAEVGRDDGPGRAVLFGTTNQFLERLGLPSLAALPPIAPLLDDATAGATPSSGEGA